MKTNSRISACWLVASLSVAVSTVGVCGDWWLEGGPVFRGGMKASVNNRPTLAQSSGLLVPASSGGIGPLDYSGDPALVRTYDNGYLGKDPGTGSTGNPEFPSDPNTTWNWGFNNAGQYNASAGTLSFFKQGAPTMRGSDEMLGAGLQLVAGLPLKQGEKWSVDLTLGFQGTWGAAAKLGEKIGGTVDSYNVSATVADGFDFSTAAGHHGTFSGPFDTPPGPGAVIPYIPASRTQATVNTVSISVGQSLYQLGVGPQVSYAANRSLRLHLRPTVSANILDVDVRRTEVFAQPASLGGAHMRWANQSSRQDVLFGMGVTGGADLDLGKGFYVGVFGGYEWVTQRMQVTVGPNTVSVDASGFVAGAVFGKKF